MILDKGEEMDTVKKFVRLQKELEIKAIHTVFKAQYGEDYFFGGEAHDFWEFVYCVSGNLGITAGKYVYKLKPGECFFHRPMEFHSLWAENDTAPEIIIITFSCDNILSIKHGVYSLKKEETKMIKELVQRTNMIFNKKGGWANEIKENMNYEFQIFINELENLFLRVLLDGYSKDEQVHTPTAEKYTFIIRIMEENIDKRLSVCDIAELCNMSEPNLKKVFKKYSGKGVMEYFSDMKIKLAKSMLKDGKSVKETAYALGFYDQNYFNVFFKRNAGISPGKYR